MSILIKGKMPNTCFECLPDPNRNVFCDGLCARLTPEEAKIARHPNCPIIGEIPDEHGELIERSKVHEAITQAYSIEDVPSIIDQLVPTVLEANT